MKKGSKIKVPKSQFVKEMKDYNNNPYYSFLYNHSVKNKQTGEWEITERYVINVMDVIIQPETEIEIVDILEAKPQIMKSKDGRDFLNCVMWVNVGENKNNNNFNQQQTYQQQIAKQEQQTYQQPIYNTNIVEEDDLPF